MRITIEPNGDRHRHLWLKAITGVDLAQHCVKAFHGQYVAAFETMSTATQVVNVPAGDPSVHAYYLCGVYAPWRWERNAHLAFVHAPGESWTGPANPPAGGQSRVIVTLEDAVAVAGWGEESIADGDPSAHLASYRTCRNWQFAHHLARVRGLRSTPNTGWQARIPRPAERTARLF